MKEREDEGGESRDDGEPLIADRADYDPEYDPSAPITCDLCGAVMHYTASCRIVCGNCGYTRDCADP